MFTRLRAAALWKLAVPIGVLGAMALLFSLGVWASGGTNPIKPGTPAAPSPSELLSSSGSESIALTTDGAWAAGETSSVKPSPPPGPSGSGPLSFSGPEPITLTTDEEKAAVEVLRNYKPLQDALNGNEYVIEAVGPLVAGGMKVGIAIEIRLAVPQDMTMHWPNRDYKGVREGNAVFETTGWFGTAPGVTGMHVLIDLHTNKLVALKPDASGPYQRGVVEEIDDNG